MLYIKELRFGFKENPIGVGKKNSNFSWILDSDQRNVLQTSYQIQVAEKEANFTSLIWDSGLIPSESSVHVPYEGPELRSRTHYVYRIRAMDNYGHESPWSEIGYFETGILDNKEWCADFIKAESKNITDLSRCPHFRKEFHIAGKIAIAKIYATSLGLYELHLNGQTVGDAIFTPGWTGYHNRLQYQTYDITEIIKKGANTVGAVVGKGWYGNFVDGSDGSKFYGEENALLLQLHIRFEDGSEMGQNMVGWVRFRVKGPAGSKVVLKHAEVLDHDGNFYVENLRSAKQRIEYILKGDGIESFEPHFTFQGFRYVKLEEYPGEPVLEDFTGIVIYSDMKKTGDFNCSNDLLNQLQHNIVWGQKGIFLDIPIDCPQRDERLGWTGDAQVFIRTACFNMNTALFFRKWLRDLKTEQYEDGGVPHVIPDTYYKQHETSSGWGDAAVICPWTIYLCYGNKDILEEQYDSMKKWVEYIRNHSENGLIWNSGIHFGDWLGLDAKEGSYKGATPEDLISTAFYAHSTEILSKTAKILNKADDFYMYSQLFESIKRAFQDEFITPAGRLSAPTQTAHVLALMFGLVPEKDILRISSSLVQYLEKTDFHLTTGFLGTPYICHVLSQNGHLDAAYRLLQQKDYPSWLYPITQGATTIWEHWDGIKPDGTFWSPDMNSFNHYAYGAIGDWMYQVIAGIDVDENYPGYKHIVIKPQPGGGLTYASAKLETPYRIVVSAWKAENGKMIVEVEIPHNTTASVTLPGAELKSLTQESITQLGTTPLETTPEGIRVELGSGKYIFVWNNRFQAGSHHNCYKMKLPGTL